MRDDKWSPVIVALECGHEVDWRGPMTLGAQFAQVCMDCPVDERGVHPRQRVTSVEGYPSRPLDAAQPHGAE